MLDALTRCANYDGVKVSPSTPLNEKFAAINFQMEEFLPKHNPEIYSPWLDISTVSPASLSLASLWLNSCLQNHRPCATVQSEIVYPSRLINIKNPQRPCITSGRNVRSPYVTLSYKWGESRKYCTLSTNIDLHETEIPLKDLPWTFKEAIAVASFLKFDYLWIDALCIVQDSDEDKVCEIAIMDQIFRCSTLTIFAAAADNVDIGLGSQGDPRWNKPCLLNLKTTLNGRTVEGSSYTTTDHGGSHQKVEPLFKRGWVSQEQVLATRDLIFSSRELNWRCLCGHATESSPAQKEGISTTSELGRPSYENKCEYEKGFDDFDLLRFGWLMKTHFQTALSGKEPIILTTGMNSLKTIVCATSHLHQMCCRQSRALQRPLQERTSASTSLDFG